MTTFEITIIVLLTAIVALFAWHCMLTRNNYSLNQTKELKRQQQVESLLSHLKTIQERSMLLLAISDRLEIHSDNCNKRLAELTDTVNKMHQNLCVEIAAGWHPASELPKESGIYVVITDFYSCQTAVFAKYDKDRGWDTTNIDDIEWWCYPPKEN